MRPHIPFLDTNKMDWTQTAPGRFMKLLSKDSVTQARTSIALSDPTVEGFRAQPRPHYHYVDEEIFCLDGTFTFDGDNWFTQYSYVFYPAGVVHGHRSAVPVPYTMMGRSSGHMTWTYLDEAAQPQPYARDEFEMPRPYVSITDPDILSWPADLDFDWGGTARILSENGETGEGSALLRLPAGWAGERAFHRNPHYREFMVLEGEVRFDDGYAFTAGCYSHVPPGIMIPRAHAVADTIIYVSFGGPLEELTPL
jgi:quercetin dioxygenase-like cupin family protein